MLKKALKLPGLIILIAGFWLGFMPDAESAADDFNGDGRSDLAVYTVASGKWFVQTLSGAAVVRDKWLGEAAVKMSIPVSGDYDGDRTSDLAVYSLSERKWYIKTLSGNDIPNPKEFPQELPMGEYVPVPGDYDGDKASDPALYELNTGKWYIYSLAKKRKVLWGVNWGFKGGIPVPGDYNRDGVDDLAIYQESTGSWYIVNISGGKVAGWIISAPGKLGGPRKKAVSGDFDGDGYSDLAVYDVDTGLWFIYSIPTNKAIAWYRPWGFKGAVPVSGDYDGDRKDDLAVYDLKNGKWYIQSLSGTNILWNRAWGGKGMAPVSVDHTSFSAYLEIPYCIEKNCMGFLVSRFHEISLSARYGAKILRGNPGPFSWGWIEPKKGTFDFRYADIWVKETQQNKAMMLAVIWPYADWDQENCDRRGCTVSRINESYPRLARLGESEFWDGVPVSRCSPCNMDDYKAFVRKLVDRYNGDGIDDMPGLVIPIKYYEYINEPEFQVEPNKYFFGTAGQYLDGLKANWEAIKSVCPDCKILHGGAKGIDSDSRVFWKSIFNMGGARYFDIANVHYVQYGEAENLNVRVFKGIMNGCNVYKPIWVTEAELDWTAKPNDMIAAFNGAITKGAEKVFFTQYEFNVGSYRHIANNQCSCEDR